MWYNRGDAMKREGDVRRLVESACVHWLDCSLSRAHVAVLMSLSRWLSDLCLCLLDARTTEEK